MVIPVGVADDTQTLLRCVKQEDGSLSREEKLPVAFVPMVPGGGALRPRR
jgi:protein-L-isoaspartate O-methyltransferase